MADVKNFLNEKEKRNQNQRDYQEKIRRHRLVNVSRVALIAVIIIVLVILVIIQRRNHIYSDYDIVNSVQREKASGATDLAMKDAVLTYSRDGAHCTDIKGNITWNQTYEMQDVKLDICRDVVAIGNYNGREIYVQSTGKILGKITTNLPIKNLAVAQNGNVTAILEDTDTTWINTYSPDGTAIYNGQTHMHNSGYPCAVSLSPNGELLGVSFLFVEAGVLKTNVAFYNFGAVGENKSDHLVSTFSYSDLIVPEIHFMDNSTAFAVGDSRLMIYAGGQKPVSVKECLLEREILSVFYSERYIGLVFGADNVDNQYMIEVYNASGERVNKTYFDLDYRNIFFEQDGFVVYNERECEVYSMKGKQKYKGNFSKSLNLMLPTSAAYRYIVVTDNSIDTVQLK